MRWRKFLSLGCALFLFAALCSWAENCSRDGELDEESVYTHEREKGAPMLGRREKSLKSSLEGPPPRAAPTELSKSISLAFVGEQAASLSGPIIVGGSGGSGTRAIAKLLLVLGVHMVVDDHVTWDVDEGFWVDLEALLLPATQGFRYSLDKLPLEASRKIFDVLRPFAASLQSRAMRDAPKDGLRVWGFKAPCSQVFLPFLMEKFPTASFVHVVRDGRDITLSLPTQN